MTKIMKFKKEARKALVDGATLMYDAVGTTLGPKGRNVAIARPWNSPINVHDGVTVAREVGQEDPFIQMGIDMIKEAAQNTNTEGGDGTTTATVLAYHIVSAGMGLLDKNINPMFLRNELNVAVKAAVAELKKISSKTDEKSDLEKVAFISSSDKEIGDIVAEAVHKMGKDGLVTVDEGQGINITAEYTKGYEVSKGYASPWFITNPDRLEAVVNDYPAVLIFEKPITTQVEIVEILNLVIPSHKNIVIIGEVGGLALETIVLNKRKGQINCVVIAPPGFNETKQMYLEDMAIITGARIITNYTKFDLSYCGRAKSVTAKKDHSAIIEGAGKPEIVTARIDSLKEQLKSTDYIHEKERLQERIAKMSAGVAVLYVGATSELERREKLERVKDAVGAAKAVLDEGVIPGGALAFIKASNVLTDKNEGEKLLKRVLQEPLKKLLENAGHNPDEIDSLIAEITKKGGNFGYNVNTGKVEDMVEAGIIDPAKVVRLALENAVAVAGSILTTDCLIADKPEESKAEAVA